MEVKKGYKQSEVGAIPVEWQVRPFMSIVNIANGQVDPKRDPYRSMILVAPDHIESRTGRLLARITAAEQRAISGKYLFSPRDVVYSKIRPYLRKATLVDFEGLCSADMYPLKAAADVSPGYLLALILANHFSVYAESVSVRSGMPKINRDELALYNAALPTLAEQEAIAGALSDADAWIESLEQLIAKKRQIKQGAMQELLTGKRRLPGFSGQWEKKRLGDVANVKTGSKNNEDKVEDGEFPFFVRSDTVERINTFSHDCEAILVPGEGRIGDIFHYISGRFDVHQRVYAITRFVETVSPRFLYFYLKKSFGVWAMQNTVKATVDSLRLPTFTCFEMKLPSSLQEQTSIATVLSDMDTEIGSLESKLAKAREIKQGMMQELLTGKIRLV
jgi:type I restriction enzyme S subunit